MHFSFAALLLTLPGVQKEPRTPCPCSATVVVVSDTALAHHPGFEGIADTSATYRLGFLNATGISKGEVQHLMRKMDLATGGYVKCDSAFLRSLCLNSPTGSCLGTIEIKAVGPCISCPMVR